MGGNKGWLRLKSGTAVVVLMVSLALGVFVYFGILFFAAAPTAK